MPRLIVRKNEVHAETFNVCKYTKQGEFLGVVSGMGKNRGTWDAEHSRSAAYRHAAQCRKEDPAHVYRVETSN